MERRLGAQNLDRQFCVGDGSLLVCVIVAFKFVCVIVDYEGLHSDDDCVFEILVCLCVEG